MKASTMQHIRIFSLFSVLLVYISCVVASSNSSSHENFIQCLENYPNPSSPISAVLYTQSNTSYSSVLQNYIKNLRFNSSSTPKPRLILTALHVSHIQAAIVCAKAHNLQMKIRSGGHDYEGISYWSDAPDFFILDMFNFRSIDISLEDESAWIQSGAILGEIYYKIAEITNTYAIPAGVCPTVGAGGHFSGGGYGNMMRKYGLSVDNIVDAQIIDVNGRLLDRKSMGEDLFWAINGGGGASFGVILSYKIKLVRVPPVVTVFRVSRTFDENFINLVYSYQQIASQLPEELFLRLTLDVVNNTNRANFLAMFLGNAQELITIIDKSFPELGLNQTDCIETRWIDSVLFWTNIAIGTPINVLLNRVTPVSYLKRKSDYLKKPIPKHGLDLILKKMVELQTPALVFNPYGGKMAEISPSEKPFPHRAGNIVKLQYATNWNEDGAEAANRYLNLTRQLFAYMTPYVSMAPRDSFLNYRDLDIGINRNLNERISYLEGAVYGVKYFKNNYKRLVKVKTKVDPDNFFRNEQSIPVFPWRRK